MMTTKTFILPEGTRKEFQKASKDLLSYVTTVREKQGWGSEIIEHNPMIAEVLENIEAEVKKKVRTGLLKIYGIDMTWSEIDFRKINNPILKGASKELKVKIDSIILEAVENFELTAKERAGIKSYARKVYVNHIKTQISEVVMKAAQKVVTNLEEEIILELTEELQVATEIAESRNRKP